MAFEYKVVPAPTKGLKARGVKTGADRFANALETTMNTLGADGWEYQRTDTLPCEEREGLMGKTTVFQNMLVFRRLVADAATEDAPQEKQMALPAPASETEPEPEQQEPHMLEDAVNDTHDATETDAPDGKGAPRVAAE